MSNMSINDETAQTEEKTLKMRVKLKTLQEEKYEVVLNSLRIPFLIQQTHIQLE